MPSPPITFIIVFIVMSPSAAPRLVSPLKKPRAQNLPYDAHPACLALERTRHVLDQSVHGLPVRPADLPCSLHIPSPRALGLPSESTLSCGPPVLA